MRAQLPIVLSAILFAACEREDREYRSNPVTTQTEEKIALSPLSPGPAAPVERRTGIGKDYEENAYHIAQTIREGRPNGMPSFRGKVPDDQIWQIAAYVRSMGRNVPKAAAPGRNDDMHPGPAELRRPPGKVIQGGEIPPSAQMPQ